MRLGRIVLLASAWALSAATAEAAERGLTIRAADLFAEPFTDAAKLGALAANQPVTILERRGGWLAVEAAGRKGWVRMLLVRLEAAPQAGASTAGMRTGSRGSTLATGVKGLDDGDIRNASIDRAQLAELDSLGANDEAARRTAAAKNLKESAVSYLKPGKAK